jgi:hypothetical protein
MLLTLCAYQRKETGREYVKHTQQGKINIDKDITGNKFRLI